MTVGPFSKCAGVRVSGYWKGYPCGALTGLTHKGKHYCAAHYSIARNAPEKFALALDCLRRREAKERKKHNAS